MFLRGMAEARKSRCAGQCRSTPICFLAQGRDVAPVGRRSRGAHFNPYGGQTNRRVFWQTRTLAVLPLSP